MEYNYNYYYYHSSIPYEPKVGLKPCQSEAFHTSLMEPAGLRVLPLGIKTAQKPYMVWSSGPKALIHESLDS